MPSEHDYHINSTSMIIDFRSAMLECMANPSPCLDCLLIKPSAVSVPIVAVLVSHLGTPCYWLPTHMSIVSVTEVSLLGDNPCKISDKLSFEIQFEALKVSPGSIIIITTHLPLRSSRMISNGLWYM